MVPYTVVASQVAILEDLGEVLGMGVGVGSTHCFWVLDRQMG